MNYLQLQLFPLYLILTLSVIGIAFMSLFGHKKISGHINFSLLLMSFLASILLLKNFLQNGALLSHDNQFYIDGFNGILIALTTFIGSSTALFSIRYMQHSLETLRITKNLLRLYHLMYQTFMLAMILTLATNNIGIMWVSMEGATLATVLLVSLYRTPEAVEAAWKYFILCIVGIALALFGTILIYFSATQVVAEAKTAIFWNILYNHAHELNPTITTIAFVFLLVGYGTKIGLVPLHNWLPDAHSESPAPMSTLLSGLLLNIALYALLRFKILIDINLSTNFASNLMIGFGIISFLFASILLHRQNNIKRLFSYSSIEHMGFITFAFGIGGKLATFAALIYMIAHSLIKSAIFMNVGNVILISGTQLMDKIRGLIKTNKKMGWLLLISTIAISGFPPFGIFTGEVMIIIATVKNHPWLMLTVIISMIIALTGLLRNIQPLVFGETSKANESSITDQHAHIVFFPIILHLVIAAILGVYLPQYLTVCLNSAVQIITNS